MKIHASSVIHPSAKIGKDAEIGPFCVIGPDTIIGDRCRIYSHAVIEYTELGEECQVFPQASLGLTPQHLGYKGEKTKLVVGPRTVFRESVTAHRGTMIEKGITTIGSDCFFMAMSHIAHDCRIGNNVIMANAAQVAGHVEVGDRCFISATVGIHQWVRIGQMALVSGGAMVPLDVAPFTIAQGDRAHIRGLNVVGMRRGGVDRDAVKLIKEAYKVIFQSGLTIKEALQDSALNSSNIHVQTIKKFLDGSKRGLLRPSMADSVEETEVTI